MIELREKPHTPKPLVLAAESLVSHSNRPLLVLRCQRRSPAKAIETSQVKPFDNSLSVNPIALEKDFCLCNSKDQRLVKPQGNSQGAHSLQMQTKQLKPLE